MTYIIALICVLGIAAGQILFKVSASALHRAGSVFDVNFLATLFAAVSYTHLTLPTSELV